MEMHEIRLARVLSDLRLMRPLCELASLIDHIHAGPTLSAGLAALDGPNQKLITVT
jgi:hypothetical protein